MKQRIYVVLDKSLLERFLKLIEAPRDKIIETLIYDFIESQKPIGVRLSEVENDNRRKDYK